MKLDKFTWMRGFAYNGKKLPTSAAIVIWNHANDKTLEWSVSHADICHATGHKSEDAVGSQIDKVVKAGWLKIVKKGKPGNKSRYRLTVPDGFDWSRCTQSRDDDIPQKTGGYPPENSTISPRKLGDDPLENSGLNRYIDHPIDDLIDNSINGEALEVSPSRDQVKQEPAKFADSYSQGKESVKADSVRDTEGRPVVRSTGGAGTDEKFRSSDPFAGIDPTPAEPFKPVYIANTDPWEPRKKTAGKKPYVPSWDI